MDDAISCAEKRASVLKPWLKYYPDEYINGQLPRCTMYEMVRNGCETLNAWEDTAISYYGYHLSYREMLAKIDEYAAAFAKCGVKRGEYVSFLTVSLPESICAIYALNKLGAVCNFIDVRTDAPHVREYILKAKSSVLVTLDRNFTSIADHMDELGLRLVICHDPSDNLPLFKKLAYKLKVPKYDIPYDGKRVVRNADFARMGEGFAAEAVKYEPDMPAVVTRTGGTTGVSKGVVLTNDSMNAISWNFKASCMKKYERNSSLLNFLPLGVSYGIAVGVHMSFSLGLEDILIPNFKPDEFDKLVVNFKPNHIIAVPTFYQRLITSPRLRGKDLSFIKTMAAGGDSANDALEDRLEEFRLEHGIEYPISQGYGMSEVSSAASFGFQNIHKKGSAGIPCVSSVIAAFTPDSTDELPIGETGELCITGASMMKEYLNEPEETEYIMRRHPDGKLWIHTGDIGYVDEDGFVYIVGRIKRAIPRFDGHKIYPLQLERVVMQHPSVRNCVAVAIKDREHTQGLLPLMAVELVDGAEGNEEMRRQLLDYCLNEIELRSQPADVIFVDKIPLTQMAKNDYRALEIEFADYDYLSKKA